MTETTKTKNKLIKGVIIAVLLTLTVALYACNAPTVPEPDAEYVLNALCEKFEETPSVYIKGKIARDGVIDTEIVGTLDDTNKRILLNVNGEDKIYSSKYLLKGGADGVTVEKANTSYNATLGLVPFSMYDFKYNKNYVGDVKKTGNHIIISFLQTGANKIFDTAKSVAGGVFSISYDGNRITETVLTTTLTEGGKETRYSAHYSYFEGGKAFEEAPWVKPTDSADYAAYAMTQIAATHGEQTLWSAGSNRDTRVTMDALCAEFEKISNVVVVAEKNDFSLVTFYSSPVQILGLGAVSELAITYDTDYRATAVTVNQGVKYVVK